MLADGLWTDTPMGQWEEVSASDLGSIPTLVALLCGHSFLTCWGGQLLVVGLWCVPQVSAVGEGEGVHGADYSLLAGLQQRKYGSTNPSRDGLNLA